MHTHAMARLSSVARRAWRQAALPAHPWTVAWVVLALLLTLQADSLPPGKPETQVSRQVAGMKFNFTTWEIEALLQKVVYGLLSPERYMDEGARHDFFLDYLGTVSEIQRLEREIEQVYVDPSVEDPVAASAAARRRLADLRAAERERQLLAEAILEQQTAVVLAEEGFGGLGQIWPPVASHFTPLPLLLVVSPRDHIENLLSISLEHGLNTAEQEAIEARIDGSLDVSSLVTEIGGMAAYPAMLLESNSVSWVIEANAHEWTHHYLTFLPLGWNYDASAEARTINETVASVVGAEVGERVLRAYYLEYAPAEPEPESSAEVAPDEESAPEPPAFDYRAEMRATRVEADRLLSEGRIEEAETYMEQRRQVFVANGYAIRKLNQAYFAFHGAYADEPGAAGADPIGPLVHELRTQSKSLRAFVKRIAKVTSQAELEAVMATPAR